MPRAPGIPDPPVTGPHTFHWATFLIGTTMFRVTAEESGPGLPLRLRLYDVTAQREIRVATDADIAALPRR
jgi:hypothetical protein